MSSNLATDSRGAVLDSFLSDQVHHFVGLFSAGINDAALTAIGQDVRDLSQRNPGDRALGDAAYQLGQGLRKNPLNFGVIGADIQRTICR